MSWRGEPAWGQVTKLLVIVTGKIRVTRKGSTLCQGKAQRCFLVSPPKFSGGSESSDMRGAEIRFLQEGEGKPS